MTNLPALLEPYRGLIYVPLDVPLPTVDKTSILSWFDDTFNEDPMYGKSVAYINAKSYVIHPDDYPWDSIRLPQKDYKTKLENFPAIVEYIDSLPFEEITGVSLIRQHPGVDVPVHSDNDGWKRITSYLLNDSDSRIFFQKALRPTLPFRRLNRLEVTSYDEEGRMKIIRSWQNVVSPEKIYAQYPVPNCSFHINNSHAVHGVETVPNQGFSRITMTVNGNFDFVKYAELLTRSLEKYKDYAIWH